MQFAFAGDDGAIPTEELFEDRYFEGSPEKVAMVRGEGGIVNSGRYYERGFERRQGETASELVVCQQQSSVEGSDERIGFPGMHSGRVVGGEFPGVGREGEALAQDGDLSCRLERKDERVQASTQTAFGRRHRFEAFQHGCAVKTAKLTRNAAGFQFV